MKVMGQLGTAQSARTYSFQSRILPTGYKDNLASKGYCYRTVTLCRVLGTRKINPHRGSTPGGGTGTWNLVTACNGCNRWPESSEPEPGTWILEPTEPEAEKKVVSILDYQDYICKVKTRGARESLW